MTRRTLLAIAALATACGSGPSAPVAIDLARDACHHCRMAIVSKATAAQIVAPGEDPLLFDDLGCLRDHLANAKPAIDAMVFVADHRTGQWVPAHRAVITQTAIETPMGSGLMAHADASSRDQDAAATGGSPASAERLVP